MPFSLTPATINALAKLVRVFDQHRFGSVILIVFTILIVAGGLMAMLHLQQ